ncbi:mechanosensitive ion channel family protein [Erythrobacter sp. HKB08]|uniref:mechanosensitive ion channel family protein n=1 Tax=Erythrobacter sp. HKB08 TaxID=2502843 RepID=UPI001F31D7C9|nr:mechanosensitive ion channel family protein [Erythrobacter sp. HKB08]
MREWMRWLIGFSLLLVAGPAFAILPAAPETSEPAIAAPATPLEETRDPEADTRIETRIREIFAEVPSLAAVEVEVSEGVVTLTGSAPDQAAIDRAETIASRFDVATVENSIERDVSVDSGIGALESLSDRIAGWGKLAPLVGVALLVAIIIGAFGYLLASFSGFWRRVTPNPFLAELVASAIRFVFVVMGLVIALDMLGAGALLGAVLGGAGVIGIALGFAMRDTIENYVASLMLSLRQPFRANDHVLIDDKEGRVIRLTSRATILMTLDGNHLRIPNSQVFKAVILNYTTNPQRRFEFELGIDADDDPNAARHLGRETLKGLAFVLDEPPPEARVEQVGDSNIVIKFLGWIDQREADWFKAKSRAIAAVKAALEDAGFGLPEPIYRLRFDARTTPLPLQNVELHAASPAPAPAVAEPEKKPAVVAPVSEDVTPQDEIAQMVEEERKAGGGDQDKDLLDHSRPTE